MRKPHRQKRLNLHFRRRQWFVDFAGCPEAARGWKVSGGYTDRDKENVRRVMSALDAVPVINAGAATIIAACVR